MKNIFNSYKILLLFAAASVQLYACQSKPTATTEHTHNHSHEEAGAHAENIAEITEEQFKTIAVEYTSISNRDLENKLKFNGTLIIPNERKATINSVYSGSISSLLIKQGDYVKQGQVVARISNPEFIQVQENYASVSSQIDFAGKEVERQQLLQQGQAGALKNLQNAEAQLKALRAQQASLRKQLQLMGIGANQVENGSLVNTISVKSPLNGYITQLNSSIGNFVDPSVSIASVEDNSNLILQINLFEKDLPQLKLGQKIEFTLANNPSQSHWAQVNMINKSLDANRTIPVHASVLGDKSGLVEGMQAVAYVHSGSSTQPSLPLESIINEEGKDYIFIDQGFDKAEGVYKFEKVEVHKGLTDGNYAAVTPVKTINPQARIVTKGAFFINAVLSGSEGHEH